MLVLVAPLGIAATAAQAQDQLWLTQFGTSSDEEARALSPDDAGGVMVAGHTLGSLGGPNAGEEDAWVARYDGEGERLWIRQFGTSSFERVIALAADSAGGVFVTGRTEGDLGGPNAGGADVFLARYDAQGNQLWMRQFGTPQRDWANALAPDGAGGVIVAGSTMGILGGQITGRSDVWIARYDSAGNQLWLRQFGSFDVDGANALACDTVGNVIVAGYTTGDLGGPNAGGLDVFMARYDDAGNQLWLHQFGTSRDDQAYALAPAGDGGVMVSGQTWGSLGGPNVGLADAFLGRFDEAGNQLWIRQLGTLEFDRANALAPDGMGGVLVAGFTLGSFSGRNAGQHDVFLAHYDSTGDQVWIQQFGTRQMDWPYALAPDGAEGVMVAGFTEGDLNGRNKGRADAFLARFIEWCYADCEKSTGVGVVDIFDFLCFQNSFVNGEPYACDCDTSTGPVCDIFDFLCFQDAFVNGCP